MTTNAIEKAVVLGDDHMALYRLAPDEDRVILPVMYATVRLNGGSGSFLYGEEAELPSFSNNDLRQSYKYQPCWLWPQEDWPKEEPDVALVIRDLEHAAEVFKHHQTNDADLSPSSSYRHLWAVHIFLDDSLNHRQANRVSLTAMLRIILRGIRHVACALDECFTIEVDSTHNPIEVKQHKDGGFELAYRYTTSLPDPTHFHIKAKGYRLVAGFMSFGDFHFTAFIWDRVDKILFHFDSLQNGREKRAGAVIASWANFLIDAGLPYDFSYVVVPATGQSGEWESGYTCLMFLQQTLRGLVGLDSMTLASFIKNQLIEVGRLGLPAEDTKRIPEFQLRFRDWCMTGGVPNGVLAKPLGNVTRREQGMRFALQTTQYMALNELGILQELHDIEGIGVKLGAGASKLHQTSGRCRADAALTPIGGKSFVTYQGLGASISGYYPHFRIFKADNMKAIVHPWRRTNKLPRETRRVKLPPVFRPNQLYLSPSQPSSSHSIRVGLGTEKPSSAQSDGSTCVNTGAAQGLSRPPPAAELTTICSADACSGVAIEPQTRNTVEKHVEAPPAYRDDIYTSAFFVVIKSTHTDVSTTEQ
ncbi:hypothetical protein V8C42DRAFT_338819 [Trichoderma barbatum]